MRLIKRALTFDDVLLVPAYSNLLPRDAELKTSLSRNIQLQIPLISAAMDTVTEARLAMERNVVAPRPGRVLQVLRGLGDTARRGGSVAVISDVGDGQL
ncbi:MAG: Inosine-5-monophosphate dehydrogenase, partial [Pseudomonadota bacterium]